MAVCARVQCRSEVFCVAVVEVWILKCILLGGGGFVAVCLFVRITCVWRGFGVLEGILSSLFDVEV